MNRSLIYTKTYKLFYVIVILVALIGCILAAKIIYDSPSTYKNSTWLVMAVFILLSIYMLFKSIFTSGYISEIHIEEGFVKKKKIYFSDITQIVVKKDELILKLDKRPWKISISDIYFDFENIKEGLLKTLSTNKTIKIVYLE